MPVDDLIECKRCGHTYDQRFEHCPKCGHHSDDSVFEDTEDEELGFYEDDEAGEREYMKAQLRNGQKLSEDDMALYFGVIEY